MYLTIASVIDLTIARVKPEIGTIRSSKIVTAFKEALGSNDGLRLDTDSVSLGTSLDLSEFILR